MYFHKKIGKISSIVRSPVDKKLIIFLGTHGINWISENCGTNVKALNHGRKIEEYHFHPFERTWGLAAAFSLCEDYIDEPCRINKEVFVTKDLGENWQILASYVIQFGWGVLDRLQHFKGIPSERILLSYEPFGKGHQKFNGWNYKIDFAYSDDFFKTKTAVVHKGNKFLLTEHYLYVAQVVDVEEQEVLLQVSKVLGKHFSFQPIEFPTKALSEHSYTFLDTTEASVFLNVNHFKAHGYFGDIYISDNEGDNFSLSLKHNLKNTEGQSDFSKVSGMHAIYIANAYDDEYVKRNILEIEKDEYNHDHSIAQDSDAQAEKKKRDIKEELSKYIRTFISFNKGGTWHRLKAPDRDFEGKQFNCTACYLNLFGNGNKFNPFYSVESAPGLIIGSGNVGEYLKHESENVGVFISRDGGRSWQEVRRGSFIYEIGDHGALMVMAEDTKNTNVILYSWDEGISWQEHRFSDVKMKIDNIIIEPDSLSQKFVLYGTTNNKGETKGVIVSVDFTNLHEPQCRNPASPDTSESDYETWYPTDFANKQCLLGRKVLYVRRKRESKCYNGERYERRAFIESCECTHEDYECDKGYALSSDNETCVPIKQINELEANKPPTICEGYYKVSRGYRRVPGDFCQAGLNFDPILIPCPYSPIYAFFKYFFYLIGFVAVAFVGVGICNPATIDYVKSMMETEKVTAVVGGYDSVEGGDDNTLFDLEEKDDDHITG